MNCCIFMQQFFVLCRLFTTVRDSLGLTYDVSFELSLFDRLKLGWYVVSVTSTPGKVGFISLYFHLIIYLSVLTYSLALALLTCRYIKRLMHAKVFLEGCIATRLPRESWTGLEIILLE